MKVTFKSGWTLRLMLTKVKDTLPVEKQSKVAYQIPCSCGKVYFGETVRRLETRIKEHQDHCQKGVLESSAVAEHAWKEHHTIRWEETSIVNESLSLLLYACSTHTLRLWYTYIALPVHMYAHCVCLHCACVALVHMLHLCCLCFFLSKLHVPGDLTRVIFCAYNWCNVHTLEPNCTK